MGLRRRAQNTLSSHRTRSPRRLIQSGYPISNICDSLGGRHREHVPPVCDGRTKSSDANNFVALRQYASSSRVKIEHFYFRFGTIFVPRHTNASANVSRTKAPRSRIQAQPSRKTLTSTIYSLEPTVLMAQFSSVKNSLICYKREVFISVNGVRTHSLSYPDFHRSCLRHIRL